MQQTIQQSGDTLIVSLAESFVFTDHTAFREVLDRAETTEIMSVRVDLSSLTFIDSAGLGMLLLLRDICLKRHKKLTLARPGGQVQKVFSISRFEHLFSIEG